VAKINSTGTGLLFSTYLGGSSNDGIYGIAVDRSANAYVTGYTLSSDFPTTPSAYDSSYGWNQDAFITKINSTGHNLLYSTFIGGSGGETGYGIAVDGTYDAYVTGWNWYGDFPTTPNAYDTSFNGGDGDVFVIKIDPTGQDLLYSTYFGGSGGDRGYGIAIDGIGNAYITGWTNSSDLPPTPHAYDASFNGGNWDVFVAKMNSTGTGLSYSTYLGGSDRDHVYGLAIDGGGNAYVSGYTRSSDFPTTPAAYDTSYNGDWDGFITKISSTGESLLYSTYLGGKSVDLVSGIAVDRIGNAYVAGYTVSSDFPTTIGAYDTTFNGGPDVFITVLEIKPSFIKIEGATPSAPVLVDSSGELYLVVRGTDNGIYYRATAGGSWSGGWTVVPGATNDVPSVAVLDGDLHIVVRGTDNGIYHRYMNLTTGAWSGWIKLPGATISAPALATSSGVLHLVVRGTDNGIYYRYWSVSGGWSSSWQQIPGATDDVPALAILGNNLHLVVRGTDDGIYHKMMDLNSRSWTGWTFIGGATSSSPSIVASGSDRLDLVVRGTDNGIYHKFWSSTSGWGAWERIAGATNDKPALINSGNALYLAVRGTDNGIYITGMDLSSGIWSGWENIPGSTPSFPVLASSGSQVHLTIRGSDNGIYYAHWG